jgi:hypothetical protein
MLEIWDEDWQLDEDVCPCDLHFIEWLEQSRIKSKSIYHFGSGGHHILGMDNMRKGAPNTILSITAAPKEFEHFIKLAVEHPTLSRDYQCYFGDIYLLNPRLLPRIDIATAFHLCEFRSEKQDAYGGLTDVQVMETLLAMIPADGRVLLYNRSRDWWRSEPLAKELVVRGLMRHVETFKTLEVYAKG